MKELQELTWDNNPDLKEHFLTQAKNHQEVGRFIQGSWLRDKDKDGVFRGCFFGCMVQTEEKTLDVASKVMGLPLWLISISERIFEGIEADKALKFPLQLIELIPVGVNTVNLFHSYHYNLIADPNNGIMSNFEKDSDVYIAFRKVAELHKEQVNNLELLKYASASAYAYASDSISAYAYDSVSAYASAYAKHWAWKKELLFSLLRDSNVKDEFKIKEIVLAK